MAVLGRGPGDRGQARPASAQPEGARGARRGVPKIETFTIDELFGNWKTAQKTHFDDGGTYDQILAATHRQ